jgi:prolyl oligopeptidase
VPPSVYRIDLCSGESSLWGRVEADIDPSALEVEQVTYPSKDGTSVTMFLVHRRGLVRDGSAPVYLTGYGGFNVSMTPAFSRSLLLWLEHGGGVAVPNIRGGGEYGEHWHQGGMLGRKQNSFDDFIAAAEWLVRERYTCPERLAVAGGSNGGLLMGAALTQRPELFRAVVIQVPLLDMLRYSHLLAGASWMAEYGDPDTDDWEFVRTFSPYHLIDAAAAYPPVILLTSTRDDRVHPGHARKFAAALAAAGHDVTYYENIEGGHGGAADNAQAARMSALAYAFLWERLTNRS